MASKAELPSSSKIPAEQDSAEEVNNSDAKSTSSTEYENS